MYYALSDSFAGSDPAEYTHGFANTKIVICFETFHQRQLWLESTRLLSAEALTREQALKLADWEVVDDCGTEAKVAYIYDQYGMSKLHIIVKKSTY